MDDQRSIFVVTTFFYSILRDIIKMFTKFLVRNLPLFDYTHPFVVFFIMYYLNLGGHGVFDFYDVYLTFSWPMTPVSLSSIQTLKTVTWC